jgi:hypothetical protein
MPVTPLSRDSRKLVNRVFAQPGSKRTPAGDKI